MDSFEKEIDRFHDILARLGRSFDNERPFIDKSPEQLLQGPFADAMTHAGQLAMLRRLSGSPIPPENFHAASFSADNLSRHQPPSVSPYDQWTDADGTYQ